jgi:hypothetical protein
VERFLTRVPAEADALDVSGDENPCSLGRH